MGSRIKIRRDSASNWTSKNPVLASGEQGYETDTGKCKIGNGTDAWEALAYKVVGESNTFTAGQRGAITALTDDTVAWDLRTTNNYEVTLTADADITLAADGASGCIGQGGLITVSNAEHITGWDTKFKWKSEPTDLSGIERLAYFVEAEDSVVMGRIS